MMDNNAKRVAFSLLSDNAKVQLWNERIQQLLVLESLNKNQIHAINDLTQNLKPELYGSDSNNQLKENIKGWIMDSEKHFSKEQLIIYFTSFEELEGHNSRLNPEFGEDPNLDGGDDCGCNKSEDYCWIGRKCVDTKCSSKHGCGIFWQSKCNGECDDV